MVQSRAWTLINANAFWYARPVATHNRAPLPDAAARPVMSMTDISAAARGKELKAVHGN